MTGTITTFNQKRGFGFVTCDQDSVSYFIHISQTGKFVFNPGDKVSFDLVPNPRRHEGFMAGHVVAFIDDDIPNEEKTCKNQPQVNL